MTNKAQALIIMSKDDQFLLKLVDWLDKYEFTDNADIHKTTLVLIDENTTADQVVLRAKDMIKE